MMPELTGSLDGLKVLDIADLEEYQTAISAGRQMGWHYFFPSLLARNRPGRSAVLYTIDAESACIFIWRTKNGKPRIDLLLPPTPMNVPVLLRCIERANDFNGDTSARILRIDAQDAGAIKAARFRVKPRKSQYLYEPQVYRDLRGKKFYTVRRNSTPISLRPDIEVVPFAPTHARACHALLENWRRAHRQRHGTIGGIGMSRRAIDLATMLPQDVLGGQVVLIDGQLVAFALGGKIRSGLACSFERKCSAEPKGLSYFQLHQFLLGFSEFGRVNDGSDAGRAGLRQLKESFRPVAMHVEHRGTQRT
ncbi:MAG: phosphatidylglycerol lysyltransferase domain-containing protein [Hyphomicrobiaceae bacterium]